MISGSGFFKGTMRFQFYILIPDFVTHIWMLEQERRAQAIVQHYLVVNDVENKSGLKVHKLLKDEHCIVVEGRDLNMLEDVRHLLDAQGFYIEGGVHVEPQ